VLIIFFGRSFSESGCVKKLELLNPNSNSSQKIKEYMLTEDLLKFLAERGFKRHDRPDPIFTLADENFSDQGNYWNFSSWKMKLANSI